MKQFTLSLVLALLPFLGIQAAVPEKKDERPWPKTVEAALEMIDKQMSDDSKHKLATIRPSCLYSMHMGWGMGLRNGLPIWGNEPLIKDAGDVHPDEVSGIIMKRYRDRLFARLPNEYQDRVREFERLLESTRPSTKKEMPMSEVVKVWTESLQKRRDELGGFKQRPFEIHIKGQCASLNLPSDFFWQPSITAFLDEEGRKMGIVYYEGDILWIDSAN